MSCHLFTCLLFCFPASSALNASELQHRSGLGVIVTACGVLGSELRKLTMNNAFVVRYGDAPLGVKL
jgi:hypothetical protein